MKAIILAAGYGTRFLPVTKTVPKEMLPILNKPSIDYIVEELVDSGISEILIISSRRKKMLEDYFDREIELEYSFKSANRIDLLKKIETYKVNISFVRQKEMLGTGHALLQAKPWIGTEPVVVAYPDDIIISNPPFTKKLIELNKETGKSVMAVVENPENINRYGVLELYSDNYHVKNIVEKPEIGKEPSNKASIGRFIYNHEFFEYLEEGFKNHKGGEYFHVYALKKLMDKKEVLYKTIEGQRLDTGEIEGFLEAIIRVAKKDPKLCNIINSVMREQ